MSYRVEWRKRLRDSLHAFTFQLIHDGADTDEHELALAEINSRLFRNPANEGESREGAERVLIAHPHCVRFEVFEAAGVVMIYELTIYPRWRA